MKQDSAANRVAELDALRGFAVLLMIVDHAALVYGAPWGVREILTRLALPLFMIVAGYLWRPGVRWRHGQLLLAALVSLPLIASIGGASVPVLVVLCLVYPALWLSHRYPALMLALCVLQLSAWSVGWYGYQPGAVLGFLVVGQLLRRFDGDQLRALGAGVTWAAPLGRYPLTLYLGHLFVLALFNSA